VCELNSADYISINDIISFLCAVWYLCFRSTTPIIHGFMVETRDANQLLLRIASWLSDPCRSALILWLRLTPPGLLGKADAIGYAVCHRMTCVPSTWESGSFLYAHAVAGCILAPCSGLHFKSSKVA
jgi:hypothetical protein